MSVLAVHTDNPVERIIGLIVREARRLVNKHWTGKTKRHVREMIRNYGQARQDGRDHGAARKYAKNRVKCLRAQSRFTQLIDLALAHVGRPARAI